MVFEGFFENIPESNTCRLRAGVTLDLSPGIFSFGTVASPHTLNDTENGAAYYFTTSGGGSNGIYLTTNVNVASATHTEINMRVFAAATAATCTGVNVLITNSGATTTAVYGGAFTVSLEANGALTAIGVLGVLTATVTAGSNPTTVGVGVKGQLLLPDRVMTGPCFGMLAEIASSGNVSALTATNNGCLGITAGAGTALAAVVNAIAFTGTDSATSMLYTKAATPVFTGYIRILVNGVIRYIPFTSTTA